MAQIASPIPIVSYARISADTKRDEHGVQDQHKVNHATAAGHGWTVVHEFTDDDRSAASCAGGLMLGCLRRFTIRVSGAVIFSPSLRF